ncbi:Stromal 70 kDa heat shock-related protein, chloroplastic, partial [Glycine soja]
RLSVYFNDSQNKEAGKITGLEILLIDPTEEKNHFTVLEFHLRNNTFSRIVDRVVSKFERVEGIDLSKDKEALVCITKEARNAIRNLSFLTCAPIRTAVENILKKAKLQVGDDYAVELRSV